jgi:hypothetical protein
MDMRASEQAVSTALASCLIHRSVVTLELKEVGDVSQTVDQADECGHGTTTLVVKEMGPRKPHRAPARFQLAPASCQDVADPIRVGSVHEGDDVAVGAREDVHRCAVLAVRLSSGMHDAEAGRARRLAAEEAVRHPSIEAC